MAHVQALKEFDGLLSQVVEAKRLSSSGIKKLTEMAVELIEFDTYLVTALYRLHRMLEPCSAQKINSLYCFDSIARACRSKVKKGLGARIDRNTGTFAGFLQQVEGILDPLVDDLVQRQDWKEGREKMLKILDIWSKSLTFPPEVLKRLTDRTELAIANAASTGPAASAGPSSSSTVVNGAGQVGIERRGQADQPQGQTTFDPRMNQAGPPSSADPRRPQAGPSTSNSYGQPSSSTFGPPSAAPGPPPPSTSTPPLPNIPANLLALLQSATNGTPPPQGPGNSSQQSSPASTYPSQPPSSFAPPPPPPHASQSGAAAPLTLDPAAIALLGQLTSFTGGSPQPQSYNQGPPRPQPPPSQGFPPFQGSGPSYDRPAHSQNGHQGRPPPPSYPPQEPYQNGRGPHPPPSATASFPRDGGSPYHGERPTFSGSGGPSSSAGPPQRGYPPPPQQQAWNAPPPPPNRGYDGPPPSRPNQGSPPHASSYNQPPARSWDAPPAPLMSSGQARPRSPPPQQRQPSFDGGRGGPPPAQHGGWGNSAGGEDHGGWGGPLNDGRGGAPPRGGGEWGGSNRGGRGGGPIGHGPGPGPAPSTYERDVPRPGVGGRGGYESGGGRGGYGGGGPSRGGFDGERRTSGGRSRWDVGGSSDGRSPPRPPPNASDYIGGRPQPSPVTAPSVPLPIASRSPAQHTPAPPPVRAPPPPPVAAPTRPSLPPSSAPPPRASVRPFIHPSRLGLPDARPPISATPVAPGLDEFGRAIRQSSADAEDEDEGPPKTKARLSTGGSADAQTSEKSPVAKDEPKQETPSGLPAPPVVPEPPVSLPTPLLPTSSTTGPNGVKRKAGESDGPVTAATPKIAPSPSPPPAVADALSSYDWKAFDFEDEKSWEMLAAAYVESKGVAPVGEELLELAMKGKAEADEKAA